MLTFWRPSILSVAHSSGIRDGISNDTHGRHVGGDSADESGAWRVNGDMLRDEQTNADATAVETIEKI